MKKRSVGSGDARTPVPNNRPPPRFIADHPGLDFLNSIGTPADSVVEWIGNGEDLLTWLSEARLIDPAEVAFIRANSFPGELDEVAAQARALREWFRDFVRSHMGRPLSAKALNLLEPLNRVLERDEGYGAIVPRPGHHRKPTSASGFELRRLRRWSTPNAVLLPVAEALAHLVCSSDFTLVKACQGKICTLLFLDTTHGKARRWCSMTLCGNRAKQAAHRQRSAKKRDEVAKQKNSPQRHRGHRGKI
ncbi:MAG TPA: ABATE domain-containing protein [Chthoniobacterales bacterium]